MFVEGAPWILRTGSPWRDLPEAFVDWNSLFRRLSRWSLEGSWRRIMTDTAYDADHLREVIAAKGALAAISNNPSRALIHPLDTHLYAQRHLVGCFFSTLEPLRRVATGFEKTAGNYRAVQTARSHRPVDAVSVHTT
jgi:transposase